MQSIIELKDRHKDMGEEVYILGSGPSLNHINQSFFKDKWVIGVNQAYKYYHKCQYYVRKESKFLVDTLKLPGTYQKIVMSKHDSGNYNNPLNVYEHGQVYIFNHLNNQHTSIDTSVVGSEDKLVVSFSTITSAIHLAAYMGFRNIILVGHDCGTLDDEHVYKNYYDGIQDTPWKDWNQYKAWLKVIESQTLNLKKVLQETYGCNIVSLNPFINFNLEGHVFR